MGGERGIRRCWVTVAVVLAPLLIATAGEDAKGILQDRQAEPGSKGRLPEAGLDALRQVNTAALHFYQKIREDPDDPENYKNLRQALFLDDRREEMASVSFEFMRRFPALANHAEFHFDLAMTLFGLQRRNEALHYFVESICLPRATREQRSSMMHAGQDYLFRAFHHVGILLEEAGRPIQAGTAILTVQRIMPKEYKYGPYLVSALLTAGRLTEAVAANDFYKGSPKGVLPRLSQKLADFSVAGSRRLDEWEGLLFRYVDRKDDMYHPTNLAQVSEEEPFRASVQAAIYQRQFPSDCSRAKVLVYSFHDAYAGFGAEIHGLGLAFNLAWYLNRTLVMPSKDDWWYTEAALCPQKGLLCYFQPISSCSLEETRSENRMKFDYKAAFKVRGYVPVEAEGRSMLFWRGQIIRFLMRPNAVLQQRIQDLRKATSWTQQRSVALHVRRGDRMVSRRIVSVDEYMAACAYVVERKKLSHVFVSTEDLGVMRALEDAVKKGGAWKGVKLMYDPMEARNSIENSRLLEVSHDLSMQAYALTAIANLFLMAECQHMVVAFHSHFGRLAYELSYGLGIPESPPVSVDLPWTSV